MLAREELRLARLGVRFINQELRRVSPGRTLEALKCHRRQSSYRRILQEMSEVNNGDPSTESSDDVLGASFFSIQSEVSAKEDVLSDHGKGLT